MKTLKLHNNRYENVHHTVNGSSKSSSENRLESPIKQKLNVFSMIPGIWIYPFLG